MGKYAAVIVLLFSVIIANSHAAQQPAGTNDVNAADALVELTRYEKEFSTAQLKTARMNGHPGVGVIFEGTEDLHYYARSETAPAPGFELKVEAKSGDFGFGEPLFPKWHVFTDSMGNKIEVYSGRFTIFVPIKAVKAPTKTTVIEQGDIEIKISGIGCTSMVCLPPFEKTLRARINLRHEPLKEITFETLVSKPDVAKGPGYPAWFAFLLAFIAGLALNIMPCVWPVLPLIVMRIIEQAKQSDRKSAAMGLTFCFGILLFFACLASANIILKIFYGTVLQWGDQFRSPILLTGMSLLLVVLAMSMFGVFSINLPFSITGGSGSRKGYSGAMGMGFLAAILSTPCGFGILAASFGWAQTQNLSLATLAIMAIGLGMAAPYAILTSMPRLLKHLPKAGRWMALFKQGIGFVLLAIAIKLTYALPQVHKMNVLYFAVVLAFCIWMWSSWVDYNTRPLRKYLIRIAALVLAAVAGWIFLSPPASQLIDWQDYNADTIQKALAQNRPVLIEFTADWCFACQAVEKMVYSREDIAGLIRQKGVLAIRADTTEKDLPATIAQKNIYKEPGVPVTLLFTPGRKEPTRWHGFLFGDELKKTLRDLGIRSQNGKKDEVENKGG